MARPWIPVLPPGTSDRAKTAFDKISSDDEFRIVLVNIYQKNVASLQYVKTDFLLKIIVQDLLEKFDNLDRIEVSKEELTALRQAKLAVDSAATKWREQRAYACTLLVILTLRKMVQENLVKLEIRE